MFESILISAVTVAIGGLMTYVIIRKTVNINYILEISDVLLDELTQNTEMQKKVYLLGILLGNGIKTGIGLTKGKGKFKMDDLIGMGLEYFFNRGKSQQTSVKDENPFKLPLQ